MNPLHAARPPSDDELVAFVYGDASIHSTRADEIRALVAADPALAQRLAAISSTIATAFDGPEPDAAFEQRLYERLAFSLPKAEARARRSRAPVYAMAASLLVAIGVGFFAGRWSNDDATSTSPSIATGAPSPGASAIDDAGVANLAPDAPNRVLAAYLVAHLENTERALLVAANSPEEGETAREIATALVESNRVYAAAAERAGKRELAAFLAQLEPVLIELANRDDLATSDLPASIRENDLPFKTRAAAALAKRELAPGEIEL